MTMTTDSKGLFITFEGGEGAGKTTQIQFVKDLCLAKGYEVLLTREPGGCKSAEEIRSLLIHGDTDRWDSLTELLLHFASRREHYVKVIEPAMQRGVIVLCDRFADSTMAYQGYAMGLGREKVLELYRFVLGDFEPNASLIFDLDPVLGLKRAQIRGEGGDRYERMGLVFHQKIREAFLDIAQKNKERCHVIDANQSIEDVRGQVERSLARLLESYQGGKS